MLSGHYALETQRLLANLIASCLRTDLPELPEELWELVLGFIAVPSRLVINGTEGLVVYELDISFNL
jgi:hypothetical protein